MVEEELPTLIALAELHWLLAHVGESLRDSHSSLGETGLRDDPPNVVGSPTGGRLEAGPTSTPLHLTPAEHLEQARRLLDDVWDRAERGPYPLFHADALNILAQMERTADSLAQESRMGLQTRPGQPGKAVVQDAAKSAALAAYEKSWLQGPPFAYAFGLFQARQHLTALGVPPPKLPPYDESQYDPMPDVEIDPQEEPPERRWPGRLASTTRADSSKPDAQVLKSRISRVAVRITAKRFCRIAQGCEATLGSVEGFPPLPQRGCVTDGPAATEPRWGTGSMPRHIPG